MKTNVFGIVTGFISVFMLFASYEVNAADNTKFIKKTAEKVWAMDMAEFDPQADMSDSLYAGASAAYIAIYDGIDAKFDFSKDYSKYNVTGRTRSSATDAVMLRRRMIKLNDSKAVEKFSDFEIDVKQKYSIVNYRIMNVNSAFGARVHKPDGTIVEVDTSDDAFKLTEGKNGKESSRRFAIPNLEPGDVIDYFYYDEIFIDELSMPVHEVAMLYRYPVRSLVFDCKCDPDLTVEYQSYNGAYKPMLYDDLKERNHLVLKVERIDALETLPPYMSEKRQIPYILVAVNNNQASPVVYHPKSARVGGVVEMSSASLVADVAYAIADSRYPDKEKREMSSLVRKWMKLHPDADETQIIDAAWMALLTVSLASESRFNERQLSVAFAELLTSLKVQHPVSIGIVSSRLSVPVGQLMSYDSGHYFVRAGERIFMINPAMVFAPGEISGYLFGEDTIEFPSDRKAERYSLQARLNKIANSASKSNMTNIAFGLKLDTGEDDLMKVRCDVSATGASKGKYASVVQSADAVGAMNRYIGFADKKGSDRPVDEDAVKERAKTKMSELAERLVGGDVKELTSHSIVSYGCTPDSTVLGFKFDCDVEGIVSRAGANLLVNVGRFIGKQTEISGTSRQRSIDVIRYSPETSRFKIVLEIPDGYTADQSSVDALARNIAFRSGNFYATAKVVDNRVEVEVSERYTRAVYPVSAWEEILALADAEREFSTASVLLVPVE